MQLSRSCPVFRSSPAELSKISKRLFQRNRHRGLARLFPCLHHRYVGPRTAVGRIKLRARDHGRKPELSKVGSTTPFADSYDTVKVNCFTVSHDSVTCRRSPEVILTAFDARPPDLPPAGLMDMGFAIICPLARYRRPPYPALVHRLAPLLHASFRLRLAAKCHSTLALCYHFTLIRLGRDLHLQAVKHAGHTSA